MQENIHTMKLLALPRELLDLIVDAAAADSIKSLKKLRLISKSLATQHAVLKHLFRQVYFLALPKSLHHAFTDSDGVTKAGIAEFVRHVTFVPPPYAFWTLEDFKRAWASQAKRHAESTREPGRKSKSKYAAGVNSHSTKQLKAGYERYEKAAEIAED